MYVAIKLIKKVIILVLIAKIEEDQQVYLIAML